MGRFSELDVGDCGEQPPSLQSTSLQSPSLVVLNRDLGVALTDEQSRAFDGVEAWLSSGVGGAYHLAGAAGTGKSTLVAAVARLPNTRLTATTGRAALRLWACAKRPARTLHAELYERPEVGSGQEVDAEGRAQRSASGPRQWDLSFDRVRPPFNTTEVDGVARVERTALLVVDEASLVAPAAWVDLQSWVAAGVKVLLVGDDYQLPPVVAEGGRRRAEVQALVARYGEDFSAFSLSPGVRLSTVMRASGGVVRAAARLRETGEVVRESDGNYAFAATRSPLEDAVEAYAADPTDHLLVTWRNATRMRANRLVRERLGRSGEVPDPGEPVLFRRNSTEYRVLNGDVMRCGGPLEPGPKFDSLQCWWMTLEGREQRRVLVTVDGGDRQRGGEWFDGGMPWVSDFRRFHRDVRDMRAWAPTLRAGDTIGMPVPVTWGYCLTAHLAQGSEFRRVTTFLDGADARSARFQKQTRLPAGSSAKFSSRWIYTATTRAREQSTLLLGY